MIVIIIAGFIVILLWMLFLVVSIFWIFCKSLKLQIMFWSKSWDTYFYAGCTHAVFFLSHEQKLIRSRSHFDCIQFDDIPDVLRPTSNSPVSLAGLSGSSQPRFRLAPGFPRRWVEDERHGGPRGGRDTTADGKISAKCCSFSAVSATIFARKYAFCSFFQNLPDYQAEIFKVCQNFANFAT